MSKKLILVTGATGYVGGRLIPALIEAGYHIRAMGRSINKLAGRPWAQHEHVSIIQGDVLDPVSLKKAAEGCHSVYYLVHSMIAQKEKFVQADRHAAENMANAAEAAGCKRIIYLGGLAETSQRPLSKHLQSRIEVAKILHAGSVPTTDLRAPIIIGSGSASFEIIRYLVERLPVMITPKWVRSYNQPIAIRDVIAYLIGCLEYSETIGQTYEIGGPDILTYQDLLVLYAQEAGLRKRLIIPVPFLSPKLSAYWIHLISPVPSSIALPLAQGLTSNAICSENRIHGIIPLNLLSCRQAIRRALDRIQQQKTDTCWMDACELKEPEWISSSDAEWAGGTIMRSSYRAVINIDSKELWDYIKNIGGKTGWYYLDVLWKIRGFIDRIAGGVGLSRGRRHSTELFVGDALDFWRVLDIKPHQRLLLLAEMKTPGEALLEFRLIPLENNQTELQIISKFLPKGLFGIIYWYIFYPFHELIFYGMPKSIAKSTGKKITRGPFRFKPN